MTDLRNQSMLILGDLVGHPTVTTDSNLDLIGYITSLIEPYATEIRITHDDTGQKANLLATIGPSVDGGVVLSGHSDVVPAEETQWTGAPFTAMRRQQRIYGRGTADMKGFIACALAMAPVFAAAKLEHPVHIAVTYDEEIGCKGAPVLIDDLLQYGPKPAAAIVGEPTGMKLVTGHKGMYEFTTTLLGLEGHGSAPDRAVNAVEYATRFVSKLLELGRELQRRVPSTSEYDPPHSTISVGTMHGGVARNVVAGECTVEWEMRQVRNDDARFVLQEVESFEKELNHELSSRFGGCSISTVTDGAVGGLDADPDSPAVRLVADLIGDSSHEIVSFGTEAGIYQAEGIPAVVCGPGHIEVAHRPDEYISIAQLELCLNMMGALAKRLSTEPT